MYPYKAYGLRFDSAIQIAGLRTGDAHSGTPDFHFESGPEPIWVGQARALAGRAIYQRPQTNQPFNPGFSLTEHGQGVCYHLCYSDGTEFAVSGDGRKVWGTVVPPLTAEDLATYFLGPVMGFILRWRKVTALHASAVEIDGRAVVFCGDAGFGKSTTAAAMALRGNPVLCEDIVPVETSSQGFFAVPGYPRVCLWPDSVEKLMGAEDALPVLTPVWEKRYLALDGSQGLFSADKLPLGMIYLLAPRSADGPRVEEMTPREALLELVQNTYMNWLLEREQRAIEFDALARLVAEVPIRRLIPCSGAKKIGALCELIEKDATDSTAINAKRSVAASA